MSKDDIDNLIINVASEMHRKWCNEELKAFFNRMQEIQKNGVSNPNEVYEVACYKNDKLRNEVEIDPAFFSLNPDALANSLTDFDLFIKLFEDGVVKIKRFTNRSLTEEEIAKANENGCNNFREGQENILRDFISLSSDSRRENLEAAIGACNVYIQLCESGVTIEQMQSDPEIMDLIGIAVHTDWIKRNKNHSDDSLKVAYSELDDWTKQQDLTVFGTLLTMVNKNRELYHVDKKEEAVIPDYQQIESELLNNSSVELQ